MHPAEETSTNSQGNEKRSYVDWARYWFAQLARHHRVRDPAQWSFTEERVIAFLRARLKAGVPSWKRVLIVKGLIDYRNKFLRSKYPKLKHIPGKAAADRGRRQAEERRNPTDRRSGWQDQSQRT